MPFKQILIETSPGCLCRANILKLNGQSRTLSISMVKTVKADNLIDDLIINSVELHDCYPSSYTILYASIASEE